jgi:hypothetical protein
MQIKSEENRMKNKRLSLIALLLTVTLIAAAFVGILVLGYFDV